MGRWWAGLTAGSAPPALPTTDPELIPRGAPVPPPTLAADLVGQRRPPAPQPPARSPQFVSLSASRAVGGPSRSGRRRPLLPRKRGDRRIGPAGPTHSGAPVSPGNAGQASPPPGEPGPPLTGGAGRPSGRSSDRPLQEGTSRGLGLLRARLPPGAPSAAPRTPRPRRRRPRLNRPGPSRGAPPRQGGARRDRAPRREARRRCAGLELRAGVRPLRPSAPPRGHRGGTRGGTASAWGLPGT